MSGSRTRATAFFATLVVAGFMPVWANAVEVDQLAFISEREGTAQVYASDTDSTHLARLTEGSNFKSDPYVFPGTGSLLYSNETDSGMALAELGSAGVRTITSAAYLGRPALSPDGSRVAFTSIVNGNFEVFVGDPLGTAFTNVTQSGSDEYDPSWSPDGSKIAFTSDRSGTLDIYTSNANGSNTTALVASDSTDNYPAWSPSGSRIAFVSDRSGDLDIYQVATDGSQLTNLTSNPTADFAPAWSEDGAKLAFSSTRSGGGDIYILDASSGELRQVTDDPAPDYNPTWSKRTEAGDDGTPPPEPTGPPPSADDGANGSSEQSEAQPAEQAGPTDRSGPKIVLKRPSNGLKRLAQGKVVLLASCDKACSLTVRVKKGKKVVGTAKVNLDGNSNKLTHVVVRTAKKRLAHRPRALVLNLTAKDQSGNKTTTKVRLSKVQLER